MRQPLSIEDRAVAKVMRRLVPLLFLGAVLAQLDRVNVSMASLRMMGDIGLSPAMYGFAVSAFFVIYALCEVPSNIGLARFGARRWLARIMVTWGLVTVLTAVVAGPNSFLINRVALAAAEAGFLPGVLAYLATWLPPHRRARAFSMFLVAIPMANVLGGPLGAALLALDGLGGLHGWQWLFVIEGLPPIILGTVLWYMLRDRPGDAEWLSPAEAAALTMERDASSKHAPGGAGALLRQLMRPQLLLFTAVLGCLGGINHAVTFWLPQIVSAQGLNLKQTGFVAAAPYLLAMLVTVAWSAHSDRTGERRWHLAGPAMAAGIALVASVWLALPVARLLLVVLAITGVLATQSVFWSVVSSALHERARTIGMAAVNAGGIALAMLAPFLIGVSRELTGGFEAAFAILGGIGLIGGALALVMSRGLGRP